MEREGWKAREWWGVQREGVEGKGSGGRRGLRVFYPTPRSMFLVQRRRGIQINL